MDFLLRSVTPDDLPAFFGHQLNKEAIHMAAFTASDPTDHAAFMAHWEKMLRNPTIIIRTIVLNGQVAGHVMSYESDGEPEVTYWLGREYWGLGFATRALSEFLIHGNPCRPIYARVAKDNGASLRVLEKCGFTIFGESIGFANARRAEIEEWLLQLSDPV